MYQAPRGTTDILPEEQVYWRYIEQKAAHICQLYGYERIDSPAFEDTSLFTRSVGPGTDIVEKEIFHVLRGWAEPGVSECRLPCNHGHQEVLLRFRSLDIRCCCRA